MIRSNSYWKSRWAKYDTCKSTRAVVLRSAHQFPNLSNTISYCLWRWRCARCLRECLLFTSEQEGSDCTISFVKGNNGRPILRCCFLQTSLGEGSARSACPEGTELSQNRGIYGRLSQWALNSVLRALGLLRKVVGKWAAWSPLPTEPDRLTFHLSYKWVFRESLHSSDM